jgi:Holliday junction resolvase RusA-like endonuclease
MEYLYKISGRCPTKKNMLEIKIRGNPRSLTAALCAGQGMRALFKYLQIWPNKKYRDWEHNAAKEIWVQRIEAEYKKIECPVVAEFIFFLRKDLKKPDLSNLIQSCEDALVKSGSLADDGLIEEFGRSRRVFIDKGVEERVEIKLTETEVVK